MELIIIVISILMPFIMVLYNQHIESQNFDNIQISQDPDICNIEYFNFKPEKIKVAYSLGQVSGHQSLCQML